MKNTTEEEEYDEELISDEVISEEEVLNLNEKHTVPKSNSTAKSYLSALNTEEASSVKLTVTHTPVNQAINYKDMLEKNIPVVDVNEGIKLTIIKIDVMIKISD